METITSIVINMYDGKDGTEFPSNQYQIVFKIQIDK
jgi:hypothetical protein